MLEVPVPLTKCCAGTRFGCVNGSAWFSALKDSEKGLTGNSQNTNEGLFSGKLVDLGSAIWPAGSS